MASFLSATTQDKGISIKGKGCFRKKDFPRVTKGGDEDLF
jgi:hypothetical protein